MTPLPIIDDTYRCTLVWNYLNSCNVIHVHGIGGTSAGVGAAIASGVNAAMWGPMGTDQVITRIDITPLDGESGTYHYTTDGSAKWKGTATPADKLPNCASVVSLKTALRGRSNRGRVFLGPVIESGQADGKINSTYPGSMATGWTNFGASLIANNMQHVVASYKNRTALTVVSYSVRLPMGTMRRRQDRVT